ncbi:MAG: dihydrolipoamide acyltransferase [Rhodospirillales bacterium]|nr:dihydrolipoamide acyltransferase [Rhodospirillales bacterium]
MPQLGETVREGTVTQWLKKPGERVKRDEVLFVVGTDKVEMEIPAPADGTLVEILVADGTTVDVGTRLAVFDDGKGIAAPTVNPPTSAASATAAPAAPAMTARGDDTRLSPVVRKLLAEHNLTAEDITGTGEGGRLTRDDVLKHIEGTATPKPGTPAILETIPFSYRRKMIAEHMSRSRATSAHVVQAMEVDFGALEPVRKKSKLTFLPFIARALCTAIQAFPRVNATIEKDKLVVYRDINLAIAVDLDFEGLMTPVIKGADTLSVPDLARAIYDLATRARAGKLSPDEMTGATYTISNSGSYGTLFTASIINQPQVAILSTDGVKKKPVVVEADGKEEIAIRPIGVLAQSFDHRAFDGAYSAAFLKRLKDEIETRDWPKEIE